MGSGAGGAAGAPAAAVAAAAAACGAGAAAAAAAAARASRPRRSKACGLGSRDAALPPSSPLPEQACSPPLEQRTLAGGRRRFLDKGGWTVCTTGRDNLRPAASAALALLACSTDIFGCTTDVGGAADRRSTTRRGWRVRMSPHAGGGGQCDGLQQSCCIAWCERLFHNIPCCCIPKVCSQPPTLAHYSTRA